MKDARNGSCQEHNNSTSIWTLCYKGSDNELCILGDKCPINSIKILDKVKDANGTTQNRTM